MSDEYQVCGGGVGVWEIGGGRGGDCREVGRRGLDRRRTVGDEARCGHEADGVCRAGRR